MYQCKMSTIFSFFLLLLLLMLHQLHCSTHWERFTDWIPKDSLACYRDRTLDLFENLKQVVEKYCIQDEENEFKAMIKTRSASYTLITKDGRSSELFVKGKKQAEEIASRAITKIHRFLSYNCSSEKQRKVNELTQTFRRRITWCGDSEYLANPITILEQSCKKEKNERISQDSDMKSLFIRGGVYDITDRWARK